MIDDIVKAVNREDWEGARELLYQHWSTACLKVFSPNSEHPWECTVDDNAVAEKLLAPMAAAFCADQGQSSSAADSREPEGAPNTSLVLLNDQAGTTPGQRRPGQICGYVFKEGEPTYSCKECAVDPTCVLCQECFVVSVHKDHRYRMYTSGGSGYCDCGDRDAWRSGHSCSIHSHQHIDKVDLSLPAPMQERLRQMTVVLLEYSARVITWNKKQALALYFPRLKSGVESLRPFQTILYNDETHTYDAVIRALDLALHCTKEQAMLLATVVDREGRTSVYAGSKESCERVATEIRRRTSRDSNRRTEKSGPLEVLVVENELACHQALALSLLSWLLQQTSAFPLICDIIGEVLLEQRYKSGSASAMEVDNCDNTESDVPSEVIELAWLNGEDSLLSLIMKADRRMWKTARGCFHQLLMKTVLMNLDQKLHFARQFLRELHREFIDDDHDHDVSIVSLSVQVLTVPPIARKLIAEESGLKQIFLALLTHCEAYVNYSVSGTDVRGRGRFDFTGRSYPANLKRALHMMRDQVYMLNQIPAVEEWTPALKENFVEGFQYLLKFLQLIQGMDEVKRQSGEHQVWEMEWETAFNIQLRSQEALTLFLAWAASHPEVHERVTLFALEAVEGLLQAELAKETEELGATHDVVTVHGGRHTVRAFDVLRQAVSIHQPLPRLLAGLLAVPSSLNSYLLPSNADNNPIHTELQRRIKNLGADLYEMPLRVLVLCAQAAAQLWRRNGFSLVNQIHNYFSPLCRGEMFDQDILMLQLGAALTKNVDDFIAHVMSRFRVVQWAESNFDGIIRQGQGKMEIDEMSRISVTLAEEMLSLLIHITSERYRPGVGMCTRMEMLEREVIHILAAGPHTFSHMQSKLASDPLLERVSLNSAVEKVGEFKRVSSTGPGHFVLKDQFLDRYDSFFYHYSRTNSSMAEQYQRKIRATMDKRIQACAPPAPIPFQVLFTPASRILLSPLLINTLKVVLDRTSKRNRFSSENLLHRVLHLTGIALHEQAASPLSFDFLSVARQTGLLQSMEGLSGTAEAQPYEHLLAWTIEKVKEVEKLVTIAKKSGDGLDGTGTTTQNESPNIGQQRDAGAEEQAAKKKIRAERASQMRAKAMLQMSKMQKTFMNQYQTEMEDHDEQSKVKASDSAVPTGNDNPPPSRITRSAFDEDEDAPALLDDEANQFTVCLGPNKTRVLEVHSRLVTCVVCQEEEALTRDSSRFVCAALVQKSQMFTKRTNSIDIRLESFLVNSCLEGEKETSTCSHTMHLECYQSLYDATLARERTRGRQALGGGRLLDSEGGEYTCPLCKRLANTALPVLPAPQLLAIPGFSQNRPAQSDETFELWVDEIRRFIAVAKPKHSRKRSHSERSLVELSREKEKESREKGTSSPSLGLDPSLSCSVPSASQMNLLIDQSGSLAPLLPLPAPLRAPSPPPALARQINIQNDVDVEAEGIVLMEDMDDADMIDDQELVMLMRRREEGREGEEEREREEEEGGVPPVLPRVEERPERRPDLAEAVQRRVNAIPTMLSGILKTLPATILAKLNKRIVPPSMAAYEESVRNFSKFLMKTESDADEARSFSSTVAVWRTTIHVMRTVAAILEIEKKPLFGALNTRQRDCVMYLSRLSAIVSWNMQPLTELIRVMLRILLHSSVSNPFDTQRMSNLVRPASVVLDLKNATSVPMSPPAVYNCSEIFTASASSPSSSATRKKSALSLLFAPERKETTFNLLHVDILALTMQLMMCIGWTWLDGERTTKGNKAPTSRELMPDGSVDELQVMRLGLVAFHFQVIATFVDSEDEEMVVESEKEETAEEMRKRLEELWAILHPSKPPLKDCRRLVSTLRHSTSTFLRPLALLYQSLRLVPPPEALRDPSVDCFDPICRFMGLPPSLLHLLSSRIVDELFDMWSPSVSSAFPPLAVPTQPVSLNQLIDLPHDFSDLISAAAKFRCPSIPIDEKTASMPTMCLLCGKLLCSQSYCCLKTVNKENIGACTQHLATCSGPNGLFLRIRDCHVVMLTSRQRGCIRPAPYVDEFGEVDQGFRRGNPLHLNAEMYAKIRHLWLHHGIAEEVVNRYEMDHRNHGMEWNHF